MKLVIVDDSKSVVAKLVYLFDEHLPEADISGFTIPEKALGHCMIEEVDLIILDFEMPGIDGLQFMRRLRATPQIRQPFVIMFTQTGQKEVRQEALRIGASDFLTKPLDDAELVARVRNILNLAASYKMLAEQAASAAKSRFLSAMSHELRTPLNGILGMAQLLDRAKLDADERQYLDMIKICGHTLADKITNILTFSNLNLGRLELRSQTVVLPALVQEIVDATRPAAERKHLDFSLELAPDVPSSILSDPGLLKQMIGNIVDNAIKFTEKGSVAVTISAREDATGQVFLDTVVSDTGIGMDLKAYRLFAPFSQENDSTSRNYQGVGLGLAVTYEVVTQMDGEIHVDSTPGEGTTFRITVPVIERRSNARRVVANIDKDQNELVARTENRRKSDRQVSSA